MNTTNISKLEQAAKEFAKISAELGSKIKDDFKVALEDTVKLFKAIPDDLKSSAWQENMTTLMDLGIGKSTGAKKTRKGGGRITDEQILQFLSSERSTGDIVENFGLSAVTVSKKLNDLVKAKKVKVQKMGTRKMWKTT